MSASDGLREIAGRLFLVQNSISAHLPGKRGAPVCFDPGLESDNLGDGIIMDACNRVLEPLFPGQEWIHIPTHRMPTEQELHQVGKAPLKILCGTNVLTSHIEHHWRWMLPEGVRRKGRYRNVILLGVGWSEYQPDCSPYSTLVYRRMLHPEALHSVRDRYTEAKLRNIGFHNVIFTGCPTAWGLTPEFCREIPVGKAENAVTTVTSYRPDPRRDEKMLEILGRNYKTVFIWPQGVSDPEYIRTLSLPKNATVLPGTRAAYEKILHREDVNYVGTRLHGGIHALNHRVRTILVAVDNRAAEMGRDLCLPVIAPQEMEDRLEDLIHARWQTRVSLPRENIEIFRNQFRRLPP